MIHLHKRIKQLWDLTEEKDKEKLFSMQHLSAIYYKSGEIFDAVDRLRKEHGKGSDVGNKLQEIGGLCNKIMIRDMDPPGEYIANAVLAVTGMSNRIHDICRILKIELREVKS